MHRPDHDGQIPQEVLDAFTAYSPGLPPHSAGTITVEKIGTGLINRSWKVRCELKPDLFLQRINTSVFHNPRDVQENYLHLWQYAGFVRKDFAGEFTGLQMPAPIYCDSETTLFTDAAKNCWRAFELIPNSKTLTLAEKPSDAKATARAFAKFTAAFEEMNTDILKEVIPGFHDLSLRYRQFEAALNTELYERMAKAIDLVNELKQRERYRHFYEEITGSGEFPKRVMHHDAKIANVLFHEQTGKVICPVDYDTVMPGYFFSDLGDMIRSMAGSNDENSSTSPEIRKDMYESIVEGYSSVLGGMLTFSERKYIHSAGLLMVYMQALRFLTDYLNGDTYYQVSYPDHNSDRAVNQLALLKNLEAFLFSEYDFRI